MRIKKKKYSAQWNVPRKELVCNHHWYEIEFE